jgi:DEAD/DEAH box helicase domain-containing protein
MQSTTQTIKKSRAIWGRGRGVEWILSQWQSNQVWREVSFHKQIQGHSAMYEAIPDSLELGVRKALEQRGIHRLYTHQVEAFHAIRAGQNVVVATPTASGKSLCYNLPILNAFAQDESARALYLFPTKALSRDQEASLRAFMIEAGLSQGAITFDGDTPGDARRVAKTRAGVLVTNPDMLHAGILPHHASWARLFTNLKFVVIDELHMYRGVFGSHLSNVIRRLKRVAAFYGSHPTFVMASATIGNPAEHASKMIGMPTVCVSESGAPCGDRDIVVYNPPVVNEELGIRQSYLKAAVKLTCDLLRAEVTTLVFGQSRTGVEVMLKYLREAMKDEPIDVDSVMGYRGGYLPGERRAIEARLRSGDIKCVVATNALELGIDIGALDAVVCAGYPGSLAALWQRFGRAGRRQSGSLAVLVASSAPLDQFFAQTPRRLVEDCVESARIDPNNMEILVQHIKCAAFELPFRSGDQFGTVQNEGLSDVLEFLAHHEVLHVSKGDKYSTYHWASEAYPASHVSLRSIGWDNFVVVDSERESVLAEMDWRSAHTMLHEQAIYQHDGRQYQVERLDFENRKAYVKQVQPDYFTTAQTHTNITVTQCDESEAFHFRDGVDGLWGLGEVSVVDKVVGFKKIRFQTHENVGFGEVNLPVMQMHTTACWLTLPEGFVVSLPWQRPVVIDALKGIVRAMHLFSVSGLMIASRDLGYVLGENRDGGSLGTGAQPGYDPTLFLFDRMPGGVGLVQRLYDTRQALLQSAAQVIFNCQCAAGCPACVGPIIGGDSILASPSRRRIALELLERLGVH